MEDWGSIITGIMALLIAIGLPLLYRKSKKEQDGKTSEIHQHLRALGVDATVAEAGDAREKVGLGRASGQKSEGVIAVADRHIDSVNVVSISTQYGTRYLVDYLVRSANLAGERPLKKTKLTKRSSPPLFGRVVAIGWQGDSSLAQDLNLDYSLADRLLKAEGKVVTGSVGIFPEPGHGYTRIRTDYSLPPAGAFEALCSIARRIQAW